MKAGILGKKIGMTNIFLENGDSVGVTLLKAGPCVIVNKRTEENDKYDAIQLGFEAIEEKKINKPQKGYFSKQKVKPFRFLREFKFQNSETHDIGSEIKVDMFKEGEKVNIIGFSKGKGFAGSIKRHNFSGGPKTHGQKDYYRATGSIGATDAARVFKGKKLPGRMGNEKVKIKNIEIVKVDIDRNLILLKGAIPGPNNSLVAVEKVS
ncbi:MAG: 50S ribosomal protein L3 [Atribacterota bacterium]|nr:50S ribosomal protein L3 [Atribacterota bacterium]MDI9596863.1 50S ribosomal protein L3 [Atribacterota bacterium]